MLLVFQSLVSFFLLTDTDDQPGCRSDGSNLIMILPLRPSRWCFHRYRLKRLFTSDRFSGGTGDVINRGLGGGIFLG